MKQIPISILSYNIHKGFSSSNRSFTLRSIRAAIQRHHPDLVLLQEVVGQNTLHAKKWSHWPSSSQFEYLAENLWPHFAYGKNAVYSEGHHGNAILSKFPIQDWENLDVSTNRLESRGMLHALVSLPHRKRPLHVICTHLGLFEADRRRQTALISQRISQTVPVSEPLLMAGDFNDWREQVSSHLSKQLQIQEVFSDLHGEHAKTFPSWLPVFRLDRIYYRGASPAFAQRLLGDPWSRLSDHVALLAQLQV